MRKPSKRSAVVAPTPPTARNVTAEQEVVVPSGMQREVMHGRFVASIVVTVGPSVEMTLIPANSRMASG